MSVPSPLCPRCGQWMAPTDLHEDGEREKPIVGVCWKCPCGFQDPRYKAGYWEELERREEEERREERDEWIAAMKAGHPDRFAPYYRDGGVFVGLGSFDTIDEAVAWVARTHPGSEYRIYRQIYDWSDDHYFRAAKPCAEGTA